MGARGRNAAPTDARPNPNSRPSAKDRAEVRPGSPAYWDLCNRPGTHWKDEFCEARRIAWKEWAPRIFARFPLHFRRSGRRPAAWWSFDAVDLMTEAIVAGRFTARQTDKMTDLEIIFWLAADESERAEIKSVWRSWAKIARLGRTRAE